MNSLLNEAIDKVCQYLARSGFDERQDFRESLDEEDDLTNFKQFKEKLEKHIFYQFIILETKGIKVDEFVVNLWEEEFCDE